MATRLNTHIYDVPDLRESWEHNYSTISEGSDSRTDNRQPVNHVDYTYIDASNMGSQRKEQDVRNHRIFDKKNLVTSFIVGLSIGIAATTIGFVALARKCESSVRPVDDDDVTSPIGNKTFSTPEKYQFRMLRCKIGDSPFQRKSISFAVKSCSDAYVVLTSNYDDSGPLTEIALGINGNTRSGIRTVKQGGNRVSVMDFNGFLNCRQFRNFWISWKKRNITVGTGLKENKNVFMSYQDKRIQGIENIGISSRFSNTGEWLFINL